MKIASETNFSLQTAAKLTRFPGGEKKFAAWLREKDFLMPNNEPYQKFCDKGWFILTAKTIHKSNPPFTVPVTRVTVKGLANLSKKVFNEFIKCPK